MPKFLTNADALTKVRSGEKLAYSDGSPVRRVQPKQEEKPAPQQPDPSLGMTVAALEQVTKVLSSLADKSGNQEMSVEFLVTERDSAGRVLRFVAMPRVIRGALN